MSYLPKRLEFLKLHLEAHSGCNRDFFRTNSSECAGVRGGPAHNAIYMTYVEVRSATQAAALAEADEAMVCAPSGKRCAPNVLP